MRHSLYGLIFVCFTLPLLSACTPYSVIKNTPSSSGSLDNTYSIKNASLSRKNKDVVLIVAFSGGGTRAAALSYGVLKELHDTTISINNQPKRLIDEIDVISSVSGGSFTSAYYGLYGDDIFNDFESVFLKYNIQSRLITSLFHPMQFTRIKSRTEAAIDYYDKQVFKEATFADLNSKEGPLIIINATDLGRGVRFSFVQEYFDLLCSDISTFPIARAVAASSAVPLVFTPVVLQNFHDCKAAIPDWYSSAKKRAANNLELEQTVKGFESYRNKHNSEYAHFVDGGISDNLGLRAIFEVLEVSGGLKAFLEDIHSQAPEHLIVISVDASVTPEKKMNRSKKAPSLEESIGSMSDVQLHRYNTATLALIKRSLKQWAMEFPDLKKATQYHFIQVGLNQIKEPEQQNFFNNIPTTFTLSDHQVDQLIGKGRELLRDNKKFKQFLSEVKAIQKKRPE